MSSWQNVKRKLPAHGVWFPTQKKMLEYYAAQTAAASCDDAKFMIGIAWDRVNDKKKAVKVYAFYRKYTEYFEDIAQLPLADRNGYELIREGFPANAYWDIEWVGEPDTHHEVVHTICGKILKGINHKRAVTVRDDLKFTVSCSTRPYEPKGPEATGGVEGRVKNSYHVTCDDIVFANNHDGRMKRFVASLKLDEDKLDMGVYTKNRIMRTLGASKMGSQVTFILVALPGGGVVNENHGLVTVMKPNPYAYIDSSSAEYYLDTIVPKHVDIKKKRKSGAGASHGKEPADDESVFSRIDPSGLALIEANKLPVHFRRFFVGENTQLKLVPVSETTPPGHIPPAVRIQMEHGIISISDMTYLYVENPKLCAADLITGQRHTHTNNNAVAVVVNYKNKPSDVYVKCFCECKSRLSKIYSPDFVPGKTTHQEMPSVKGVVKTVIETVWGLGNVDDQTDRCGVLKIYNSDVTTRKKLLDKLDYMIMWKRILPFESWCFIPRGVTVDGMMQDMAVPVAKKIRVEPKDEPRVVPTVTICPFIGNSFTMICPVCDADVAAIVYDTGAMLRKKGKVMCTCVLGHTVLARLDTYP